MFDFKWATVFFWNSASQITKWLDTLRIWGKCLPGPPCICLWCSLCNSVQAKTAFFEKYDLRRVSELKQTFYGQATCRKHPYALYISCNKMVLEFCATVALNKWHFPMMKTSKILVSCTFCENQDWYVYSSLLIRIMPLSHLDTWTVGETVVWKFCEFFSVRRITNGRKSPVQNTNSAQSHTIRDSPQACSSHSTKKFFIIQYSWNEYEPIVFCCA